MIWLLSYMNKAIVVSDLGDHRGAVGALRSGDCDSGSAWSTRKAAANWPMIWLLSYMNKAIVVPAIWATIAGRWRSTIRAIAIRERLVNLRRPSRPGQ